jgi:hypothetical protein
MFFTDDVVVCKGEQEMGTTRSSTLEMYVGPAAMVFHIPFDLGHLKVCAGWLVVHSCVCKTRVRGVYHPAAQTPP